MEQSTMVYMCTMLFMYMPMHHESSLVGTADTSYWHLETVRNESKPFILVSTYCATGLGTQSCMAASCGGRSSQKQ